MVAVAVVERAPQAGLEPLQMEATGVTVFPQP